MNTGVWKGFPRAMGEREQYTMTHTETNRQS